MTTSKAEIGYGITFEMADPATPTTYTFIAEVTDLTPPSGETDQIEVTHTQSPNRRREYIPGLTDPGDMTFDMNLVPGSASDLALEDARGKSKECRIIFPNGVRLLFSANLQTYEKTTPVAEQMTASVSWKVTGEPLLTAAEAPANIVAPSIAGTATSGARLRADAGVWGGAESIAYQWQSDGGTATWADITGATKQSFLLTADEVGDDVRVVVTATNSAGQTVVNAAETDAVT